MYVPRNQAIIFLADTNSDNEETYEEMTNDQLHIALYLTGLFDDESVVITGYEGGL